jgi:hypothetical protein
MLTLKEINERNAAFWGEQSRLRQRRIEDPALVEVLDRELQSTLYRLSPAYRTSVEDILANTDRARISVLRHHEPLIRKDALREQARKAGKSKTPELVGSFAPIMPNLCTKFLTVPFEALIACFPLPPPRITHPWTPRAARCG